MMLKLSSDVVSKYAKFIIVICWLFTTILYLRLFGIVTNFEAVKYISEAHQFVDSGSFSASRYWFYCITIFIIVIALKLKIGLTGAFVLQSLLNICAYLYFYSSLKKLFQIPLTALLIIIYLLFFWPYQDWVVYLFTESAFFSLILILTATLIRYKPDNLKNILIILLALILVIISRPLGILFAGSIFIYIFSCANKKWKIILGFFSLLLLMGAFYITNTIFSTIKDWHITQGFEQESIICDLPGTVQSHIKLDLATSGKPVFQLFYYVTHNFAHFLHFAGVKLQYFFFMTRPYYSKAHNYFLLFNTIIIYLLLIGSFFIKQVNFNKAISLFLITSIALYTLTIIFQCDDYHNRFILSIFPFFVILGAGAAEFLVLHFFKNNKQTSGISIKKTTL
jgi:hypothetical protein